LLLKNTPLIAIAGDLTYLALFALLSMLLATWLFQRTL
jgi:hypothetical protein